MAAIAGKHDCRRLEQLCNADRFRRVEQLHRRAFDWQAQGYIGLENP